MNAAAAVIERHPEPRDIGSYDPDWPTPTSEQYEAFQVAFKHFNDTLFKGNLPPVMLTVASRAKSFGYYIAQHWRRRGTSAERIGEIALCREHLGRDERAVAGTLVHEMMHHWQHVAGKPSRRGYHNREWADRMVAAGLMPSNTGQPGGKRTGQRVTHYIIAGGPFERAFENLAPGLMLPFISDAPPSGAHSPGKKVDASKVRFTCFECSDNAWGKPTLQIGCRKCGVPMTADVLPLASAGESAKAAGAG
jgi:hypothetical protein